MRVTIRKWGNSAAVRIPAAIIKATNLGLDQSIDIREENGRIIIEPIRPGDYNLAQLLAGITPDNLHTEISFGPVADKKTS